MAQGKDPETSDGLGGVHKIAVPRQPVPSVPRDPGTVAVGHGPAPGSAGMVEDHDQIAHVVHTEPTPVEPPSDANARESTLRPMRTPQAPFQDARIAPNEPSAWSAEKDPTRD